MSDSPKRAGQPPVFWIGVGAAVLALGLLITRIAVVGAVVFLAGALDFCIFAPLVGMPFSGRKLRASF